MRPLTFALMLLAQRVDEALRRERLMTRPNRDLVKSLSDRKQRIGRRLRRSLSPMWAEG